MPYFRDSLSCIDGLAARPLETKKDEFDTGHDDGRAEGVDGVMDGRQLVRMG